MKRFKVKVKMITPYMQHRMDDFTLEKWEQNRGRIIERSDIADEDAKRADFYCYRNREGQCYIPAEHLRGAMINAGTYLKSKVGNSRKSMKNIVAAMFLVEELEILIPEWDEIDKRSAVNNNVKARIITLRPKWNNLEFEFTLNVSNDTLTVQTVKEVLKYAGDYCGIGSFRPTNNGMFGRFVTEVEELALEAA